MGRERGGADDARRELDVVRGVLLSVEREGAHGGGVDAGDGGEVESRAGVADGVDHGARAQTSRGDERESGKVQRPQRRIARRTGKDEARRGARARSNRGD